MNEYQHTLYNQLMTLVETSEKKAFFFADQELSGITYRIFNYRLASYTDFMQPGALECRGIMFRMDTNDAGELVMDSLASHPMQKFFNIDENPSTMGLDYSTLTRIMDKADGSLISTFLDINPHDSGKVWLGIKSKGSLHSEQAQDTREYLGQEENREFCEELIDLALSGITANMEWCAPHNRIVIGYDKPHLVVLNARNNNTGEYVNTDSDYFRFRYPVTSTMLVKEFEISHFGYDDATYFVESIAGMTKIEGFVLEIGGQFVKKKTDWYVKLHQNKNDVNCNKRLFDVVLNEASDDMRSLFHDDQMMLDRIEQMEQLVFGVYNNFVSTVETYAADNRELSRKDYAIKGQQCLTKTQFGVAMMLYVDRPVDYKSVISKHKDLFVKSEGPIELIS